MGIDPRPSRTGTGKQRLVPQAPPNSVLLLLLALVVSAVSAMPAHADRFSLTASGTISTNSSGDTTIPVGTPWTFELVYDAAAPDLDSDPTSGRFTNAGATPALISFDYRAGDYEVTIGESAGFGAFSEILITFSAVYAIDVNIQAPASFPTLAGGEVSFHADFNDFSSRPIFQDDALPTNPAIDLGSFDQNTVSLLPAAGGAVSSTMLTSLAIAPVPEPSSATLAIAGLLALLGMAGTSARRRFRASPAAPRALPPTSEVSPSPAPAGTRDRAAKSERARAAYR